MGRSRPKSMYEQIEIFIWICIGRCGVVLNKAKLSFEPSLREEVGDCYRCFVRKRPTNPIYAVESKSG